jgi:Effector-associated domain 1
MASLEEGRDRVDEAISTLETAERQELLAGRADVRLEILLNRINVGERRDHDDEDTRWSLKLDARALLGRAQARTAELSTALVRLLAAALGRRDQEWVREAAGRIGLGHDEDSERVAELVRAISAWDAAQSPAGELVRACGLRYDPDQPDQLPMIWTAALTGIGTDGASLLKRLWSLHLPPEDVREALRGIYLWWGLPGSSAQPGPVLTAPVLPDALVLDYSRPETRRLEECLRTAYPNSTQIRVIVDRAGLDARDFNWNLSGSRLVRELLTQAVLEGRVADLIRAVLDDRSAATVHGQLRDLMGEAWLRENGFATSRRLT